MKQIFRFSTLLLALLLPYTVLAHDFEVDGIYYDINGNEATVTYYHKGNSYSFGHYKGDITIPSNVTYDGTIYTVTAIGGDAFYGCSDLTSIDIPNTITSIDTYAFYECSGLINIKVAHENPIYDSRDDCNAIVETATNTMIVGCSNTNIPNTVSSIGLRAFYGSGLTSITIPNSVKAIGEGAFNYCGRLTSLVVENDNAVYDSRNDCNAIIETATNTLIVGCQNTIIPNSIISIGDGAFSGCTGLTSIDIPNSIISIGVGAFSGCSELAFIEIPNSVANISSNAFYGTSWYDNQPDGVVYAGLTVYKYKGTMPSGTQITLRDGTTGIASDAFSWFSTLRSIIIPNSVTHIGEYAFAGCYSLTRVTMGDSVTFIGARAFSSCRSLSSIDLPNSVTYIGDGAFSGCSGLTGQLIIPNNVLTSAVLTFRQIAISQSTHKQGVFDFLKGDFG